MRSFRPGDSASISKTITDADVECFAALTGDTNPLHLDEEYASATRFGRRIAHGMLCAALISAVLARELPGPGTIYLGQTLTFLAPVYLGDTVTATVTVVSFDESTGRMTLATVCTNGEGEEVIGGEARVVVGAASGVPSST